MKVLMINLLTNSSLDPWQFIHKQTHEYFIRTQKFSDLPQWQIMYVHMKTLIKLASMALTWNGMGVTVKIWDKYYSCCIHLFPIQYSYDIYPKFHCYLCYCIYTANIHTEVYSTNNDNIFNYLQQIKLIKIIKIDEWQKHILTWLLKWWIPAS